MLIRQLPKSHESNLTKSQINRNSVCVEGLQIRGGFTPEPASLSKVVDNGVPPAKAGPEAPRYLI